MTRKGLRAKEVGDELTIDIARYRAHPGCKTLFCLVYDPEHRVKNPRGIEADLAKEDDDFQVKVFIVPKEPERIASVVFWEKPRHRYLNRSLLRGLIHSVLSWFLGGVCAKAAWESFSYLRLREYSDLVKAGFD